MSLLLPNNLRINGYYTSYLQNGGLWFLSGIWMISIVRLLFKKYYWRGLGRIAVIPVILVLGTVVELMTWPIFYSSGTGSPIYSIYSKTHNKYFILAKTPPSIDVTYRILSCDRKLYTLLWRIELAEIGAHYFDDNRSLKQHLVLSDDEEVLVISRGNDLTDTFLIDSMQPLMGWNREQSPEGRSAQIKNILAEHTKGTISPNGRLAYTQVRTLLKEYLRGLGNELNSSLDRGAFNISCDFYEVDQNDIQIHAYYHIKGRQGEKIYWFNKDMQLVEDHGKMIITEQDQGLGWSNAEEKQLGERVRDAINTIAGPGTYVNIKNPSENRKK